MYVYNATYEDFNGVKRTEDCYFNVNASELFRHSNDLEAQLTSIQKDPNPQDVMTFIDTLVRLSYGEKSEDGRRFIKSEEKTEAFMSSPVYDQFLFDLMNNPNKSLEFAERILPAELAEKARALAKQ